jgi:YgiT-type zinc finger domain-containing protein
MLFPEQRRNIVMMCDICGKDQGTIKLVTRSFGKKKNLLIIEDIPVVSCTACGESYMTAETLNEIERIKMHRHSFAIKRQVEVTVFA